MEPRRRSLLRAAALGVVGTAGCASGLQPTVVDRDDDGPPETVSPVSSGPARQPLPAPEELCRARAAIDDDDPLTVDVDARELLKCTGRPFENFEEIDDWEPVAGSAAADAERVYSGSQSVRLEAGPDQTRVAIERRFPAGIDLSGQDLSVAMRLDEPAMQGLKVDVRAPDAENALLLGRYVWRAGWVRADLGPIGTRGSPDLSDVRGITLSMYTGGASAAFNVDSLRRKPRSGPGRVVLSFNGAYESQHEVAFPIMEDRGYQGVVGVTPRATDWDQRLSLHELNDLQDAGWDVASTPQASGGLRALSADEQRARIRDSKRWLLEYGFEDGADVLFWPSGRYDRSSLAAASRHHSVGFAGGNGPFGMVSDPLVVERVNASDLSTAKRAIDLAAAYDQNLVLTWGGVGNMTFGTSRRWFEQTLDLLEQRDLEVVTATELWDSLAAEAATPTPSTTGTADEAGTGG